MIVDRKIPHQTDKLPVNLLFASYFFFLVYVIVYNYFYLHHGYGAHMDEGYLLSLGKRITAGQIPYIDFYFLRTPFSIYIQAFFISLFGDFHTLYLSRILYVFQLTVLIILISDIYRKFVNKFELTFLLVLSYTISTLILQFQWYSYDGLFFAGLSLFLLNRKMFLLCGVSLFLAGMSKQNYFLLLPAMLVFIPLFLDTNQDVLKKKIIISLKVLSGFCVSAIIAVSYFLYLGNFKEFINQSFFMPKEMSNIDTIFVFIQNNPEGLTASLLSILIIIILYYNKKNRTFSNIIAIILLSIIASQLYSNVSYFIFNIIFINYTIAALTIISHKKFRNTNFQTISLFLFLTIFIQYLSGFNYGGLFFAYMGAGLAIPFTYIAFKKNKTICSIALSVFVVISLLGLVHKTQFVYKDAQHSLLDSTFSNPKLRGIISIKKQTNIVDKITEAVKKYSEPNDYVFFFPNNSAFYYLTDRKNPTKIEWYYKLEFNSRMLTESAHALNLNKPKVVVIDTRNRYNEINHFISRNYTKIDSIENVSIYILNKY